MSNEILYRVQPASLQAHIFDVEILIPASDQTSLILSMPAWIPGSYMIRDFARNLLTLTAAGSDGLPVRCEKRDKQTWVCGPLHGGLRVGYRVYAGELGVRAAHLDTTHAFFNGSSLFLRVQGLDDAPCRIELHPSQGWRHWHVATSLKALAIDAHGFGIYRADSYEDLIDHPVEIGHFDEITFRVRDVPHRMVLSGRHYADMDRIERDLKRICEEHAALFGELPIDRYLFMVRVVGEGYGGLEHRFSTSLMCSRDDLSRPADEKPTDGYVRFLGLCSHEYFHLWHVKRIRPAVLMGGGLEREVHTRTLWAFEGITSYYDELALVRSGCIDVTAYLGLLAAAITRLMRTPGRGIQSLAEASFDAWTKFYKPDENAPNVLVSYYLKGALVALALDLTLRLHTQGAVSLDDVMRELWVRHGKACVGVEEHGIEVLASEVSGLDLTEFFKDALDGTQDLDLQSLLAGVGIGLRFRPPFGPKDFGGCVKDFLCVAPRPTLDLRLRPGAEAIVQHVIRGGAGEQAGIAPGDQILAVDGLRATSDNLGALLMRAAERGTVTLHLFRRDELLELTCVPTPARADTCELMLLDEASEPERRARAAWLASRVAG